MFFNRYFRISLFFLLSFAGFVDSNSQTVSVDDTNYSPKDMVDLLVSKSCAITSNRLISSSQSVAYFNSNGSNFPLNEGIIIRNGVASLTAGRYTGNGLDSEINKLGDSDLQQISDANGQLENITDVAFLEFDFVPTSTNFSFNFLLASNEYGEWQCGSSDVFAFILTNTATGESKNLAVVPGTDTPISVKDIRDSQFNSGCTSINPQLFDTYNVQNPDVSTINMRGYTKVLNATSEVIPNNPYRIKLVIGDYKDARFDSAVFIEAGSFNTYLNIGEDISICSGNTSSIDSGFTDTVNFSYQWELNGSLLNGENNPFIDVLQFGIYKLTVTNISTNCSISDEIVVSELQFNQPNNISKCGTDTPNFDLTQNDINTLGLDSNTYEVFYYASLEKANNNEAILNTQLTSYPAVGGETIYMKVQNKNTLQFCSTILSFGLNLASFDIKTPDNITACIPDDVNITQNELQVLNGLNTNDYTLSYFRTQEDANNNLNPILNPSTFSLAGIDAGLFSTWIRVESVSNTSCFKVVSQTIDVNSLPEVERLTDVYECTEYTLPPLTSGNYFTGPDGSGTQLNAGDIIDTGTTIYIYNENRVGCTNQLSFKVNMADEYTIAQTVYCGVFIVPSYPNASFYTATGGPNGTGTQIPAGTRFTENITIFFYALDGEQECVEKQFDMTVNPLPEVDKLENVVTCDSFTLPRLTNGNYYTGTIGGGNQLNAGDEISTSQTIYIYNINLATGCNNQSDFKITIIDTNIYKDSIDACDSYTLPEISMGGYFTQPRGAGQSVAQGTVIESSQIIYYYVPEITTPVNCTDNLNLDIRIHPIPEVDTLDNITRCISEIVTNPIILPTLTNGNYFTQPNGQGEQLNANTPITSSQVIYIYNKTIFPNTNNFSCDNESSFTVDIRPIPKVDNLTNINSCDPFTLPVLRNGNYFTEPNGQGIKLNAGDIISETTNLYIFNNYDDLIGCSNENFLSVNILGVQVDEPNDVNACDTYTLPQLSVGNYFSQSGGTGKQYNAGDIISSTQTFYIYAENGNRFSCDDEHIFTVNIFTTPTVPFYPNIESCGSLTLPNLFLEGTEINYYRQPGGIDLINPINYTITDVGTQTIYVRANSIGNKNCTDEESFQMTVHPLLDLAIQGGVICVDAETNETTNPFLMQSGLDPSKFTVSWFLNGELLGTGPDYLATKAGTYDVSTEKLTPDVGPDCNYKPTQVVIQESKPQFELEFLTQVFSNLSDVRINTITQGLGSYEFSIDGGSFQADNTFYSVSLGDHFITVRDTTGICNNDFVFNFTAIDYPTFFTPNDDGKNDLWTISDLKKYPEAEIKIYTRHGVLVSAFKPAEDNGWNGFNNNGNKMPSSDYWFLVDFVFHGKPVQYHSHFALIRR